MHGEDFQPAVQGVTCPGSVNNSNCAYNFLCVALKIHPTDFSSMSSNSAAIYYSLRVETRTLKLQNGSGCLRSPPFPTLFPVSINRREGPRTAQTKQECIPKGCSASCVVMAPWPWPGLCWSPGSPCRGQQMSDCVWTSLFPGFPSGRSGPGGGRAGVHGPRRKGTAAVWCRVNTHRGPESGRGGSSHTAGTNKLA